MFYAYGCDRFGVSDVALAKASNAAFQFPDLGALGRFVWKLFPLEQWDGVYDQ